MNLPPIVVFDCNIFLQAMLSSRGPAAACIDLFRRGEFAVAVSPFVLAEVRGLPSHPDLRRFASLTPERVERFIIELLRTVKMVQDVPRSSSIAAIPTMRTMSTSRWRPRRT